MKKNITLFLIAIALGIHLLKLTGINGRGQIITATSLVIFICFIVLAYKRNWKSSSKQSEEIFVNGKFTDAIEEECETYHDNKFEKIMYFGFALLVVGGLFKSLYWPGADIISIVATLVTVFGAGTNLISSGNYSKNLKTVSIAGLAFAAVVVTNYYWVSIHTAIFAEYKHYMEICKEYKLPFTNYEKAELLAIENEKAYTLPPEAYNTYAELQAEAEEMVKNSDNAKFLYLITSTIDKYGNQVGNLVYDAELYSCSMPLDLYANHNLALFRDPDLKFYVVTNNPEEAKKLLTEKSVEGKVIIIVD